MDKTRRYDRQLRLWKAHGQARLEAAHICLLNGTATGSETLKNLVLPVSDYSLIIATQCSSEMLIRLAANCQEVGVPLVVCETAGFIGYLRIQIQEHTIIESYSGPNEDLRLDRPFPTLTEFVQKFDLNDPDSMAHGQIPYIVILLQYYQAWQRNNPEAPSMTLKEKKVIREAITRAMRHPDEENFEEAAKNVLWALNTTQSPDFWVLARAMRDFVQQEGDGMLPLSGHVSDMKTDTANFVAIQSLYYEKAESDCRAVHRHVHQILTSLGRPVDSIPRDAVQLLCKDAARLRVQSGSPYRPDLVRSLQATVPLELSNDLLWYIAFALVHQDDSHPNLALIPENLLTKSDARKLHDSPDLLLSRYDYVKRHWDLELHNIAAILGGMAAQEIVKLITHQYIPLNNTCLVNGIDTTSATFKF
ncbi:hypothetical protein H4R33_001397 [Dimargaris cristalligena]|nr:hypothetical protein H4R33_001397 [Dimargaris cristalligena]